MRLVFVVCLQAEVVTKRRLQPIDAALLHSGVWLHCPWVRVGSKGLRAWAFAVAAVCLCAAPVVVALLLAVPASGPGLPGLWYAALGGRCSCLFVTHTDTQTHPDTRTE